MSNKLKCDVCGKFISYHALDNGQATRKLITPDSHLSCEDYETLCKECRKMKGQDDKCKK